MQNSFTLKFLSFSWLSPCQGLSGPTSTAEVIHLHSVLGHFLRLFPNTAGPFLPAQIKLFQLRSLQFISSVLCSWLWTDHGGLGPPCSWFLADGLKATDYSLTSSVTSLNLWIAFFFLLFFFSPCMISVLLAPEGIIIDRNVHVQEFLFGSWL